MKNLKKTSLLIAIFSITVLLSSLFADKASAQICVASGGFFSGPAGNFECCNGLAKCSSTGTCETSCAPSTPPPPASSNTCKADSDCQQGFACADECTDLGPAGLDCRGVCRQKDIAPPAPPTSTPIPLSPQVTKLVWQLLAVCTAPQTSSSSIDSCDKAHNFTCPTGKTCNNKTAISDPDTGSLIDVVGTCEKEIALVQPPAAPASGGQTPAGPVALPTPTIAPTPPTAIPAISLSPTTILAPSQVPIISIPNTPPTPTSILSPAPTITVAFCSLKNKGDADCDDKITLLDFDEWFREFVREVKGISTPKASDFNKDGIINIIDFNIWKTNFQDPSLPH